MASRPRRAAAQRANKTITDMVDSDNHISSRTGKIMSSRASRRSEVKLPASKLRQATSSQPAQSARQAARDSFSGGEIIQGKRNRSQKKSYVVETSDDEEEEDDDEDAEGEDDDMMDDDEEDAEGEIVVDDTMDIDAEAEDDEDGEEDAEGEDDDMDMSVIPPPAPVIKVSKPPSKRPNNNKSRATKPTTSKAMASHTKDSDDEELSELESDADEIQDTVKVGGGDEEDAEGEDEEIEEAEPAEDDLGSDDDGSEEEAPDLTKMTKRQRARFEENGDALMKLSDEVQAKKHFTAEELSMRRAEMARRRRNLSEKRNEEVKMETINKLLKKQAPKTNRKAQAGMESTPDIEAQKPNPIFVRWVSSKDGSRVSVPDEMLAGPAGKVFVKEEMKPRS
ncbi:PAPA-1-like conserved region-domain-containing protein [Xylaria bambusicola]|uniref:PAPA-1-like conserved region-domain-containing protein n=1 Tax=Xylaria bambusicola TaxID=326684 RepID=UPI002008A68F|nr:PAPA-1-like conserved region-domain-containing protein [Xylaria bambusicola]KAI0518529.1 PAPA-1-like conserved region-domain-containing protein [Xylaria bambusicola]